MVTRDFDARLADRKKAAGRPTFKLAGQEFTLRAKLPFRKWNKVVAFMRADDTTQDEAMDAFFNLVLIRVDRPRFADLLDREDSESDDDEDVVDWSQVDDLMDWAMEHFTGKNLSSASSSTDGASETDPPRNVVSLSSRTANG